jgi:hypothetical protein
MTGGPGVPVVFLVQYSWLLVDEFIQLDQLVSQFGGGVFKLLVFAGFFRFC